MKRGFTLTEVMGVIVILSCIVLIIIPAVDKQLKEGKKDIYESTINSIKSSLDLYMNDINLKENDSMQITLYQLKQAGYVDIDIKNPVTNNSFYNDTLITILNDNGIIKYSIDDSGATNSRTYESIPRISLNGNTLEYVELGDTYEDFGAQANYNNEELEVSINSNVNTNVVGVYKVLYTANYIDTTNEIIRTVIVKDTKGPNVSFNTLNISLSQVNTYDFRSDIVTSDLSGIKSIDVETNFGALTGTYSVKYIVTDNYDNQTIKYRKVITS